MSHKVDAYTIYDIAKWQVELEENIDQQSSKTGGIQLPTLQRGFVWQPHQMEALWDSILRGYPVGSLLMSKDINNTKYLLDGQQRCTTIALGFQNPLKSISSNVLNIKKENIPSVWIDLKPLRDNQNGLRFAVRVLTRSHPWGYRLSDHTKRLSMSDQRNALEYFRKKSGEQSLGFSQLDMRLRSPWDCYYPVPLALILETDKSDLKSTLERTLINVETKHGICDYNKIEEDWLDALYKGIDSAKSLLLPEIVVDKSSMEEGDVNTNNETGEDAVLFLRLNSSGTRISGQELIYSLIKASLPEAKDLVEEIGLNFLSPTTVVNLFVRFIKMKRRDFQSFERNIGLQDFRKLLVEDGFKEDLKTFILSKDAKTLMDKAVAIINSHPSHLPPIFYKEVLSKNTDLLLVLLVFVFKNEILDANNKKSVRSTFLHSTLFSGSKEKNKIIPKFYTLLTESNWQDWSELWNKLCVENHTLLPPLLDPKVFSEFLSLVSKKYLEGRNQNLFWEDWLKNIFRENDSFLDTLPICLKSNVYIDKQLLKEQQIEKAVQYWRSIFHFVFWNKQLLILVQRDYLNNQFGEFMAFEGLEDTNKPWDWDHIYPNSWVHNKKDISILVRWLLNSNGNFRALSFNENRSQSNNQSPEMRFRDNVQAQNNSFVCKNDLAHWLELTNSDSRLKEEDSKVNDFVNAVLIRIDNIYKDSYEVIFEKSELYYIYY
ncbi:DUF262 domain-containing protein [Cellulophaga baltica]|uniref:DUF262 domain-containing protein n=1 Tax=Cellulophaga baltica TaxID=76594 RepID=UPI0037C8BF87